MEESSSSFNGESDICQQLLEASGEDVTPRHRHLCATAEAYCAILKSESRPLTPLSYFTAIVDSSRTTISDDDAVSGKSWLLAIVFPLIPDKSKAMSKAAEAMKILVEGLQLEVYSVRALSLVKCLGLMMQFSDLEDWESVKSGFQALIECAVDKRPNVKVRKCAQDCAVKVFESFQSCNAKESANKLVMGLFRTYMCSAVKAVGSRSPDGSEDDEVSKNLEEVVHMFDVLKMMIPCSPREVISEAIVELQKLFSVKFPPLTRHAMDVMVEMLGFFESKTQLTPKNSIKVVSIWNSQYCSVLVSIAGLLTHEEDTAKRASDFLTKVIRLLGIYVDNSDLYSYVYSDSSEDAYFKEDADSSVDFDFSEDAYFEDDPDMRVDADFKEDADISEDAHFKDDPDMREDAHFKEDADINENTDDYDEPEEVSNMAKALSCELVNVLSSHDKGTPNEHVLAVISKLYCRLGTDSNKYMSGIIEKLASFMTIASGDAKQCLQDCIGHGVCFMGADKVLAVIPITLDDSDLTCSNTWLIPIIKDYVVGESLEFFIGTILPLAESLQEASKKEKNPAVRERLQSEARCCWGLLPSFCRHPRDTYQKFGSLVEILTPYIDKGEDAFMLEDIAIALQYLVKQNKNVSFLGDEEASRLPDLEYYHEETARKNIEALSSWSGQLLKAFTELFFQVSAPNKHSFIKDTVGCLALITEYSVINAIFTSSLRRRPDVSVIVELASLLVSIDPTDLIYDYIKECLQDDDYTIQWEAYGRLYRILVESSEFATRKFVQVEDLLLHRAEPPADITAIRWRFLCLKTLLVHSFEITRGGENEQGRRILCEFIQNLNGTSMKVACDILLETSSVLQNASPSSFKTGPYPAFIALITSLLSWPCPRIKSGAVSALSLLMYFDSKICSFIPDIVPPMIELLDTADHLQVIDAIVGFLRVLVSSLQFRDFNNLLFEILRGLLPWSSVSEHQLQSKVTFILEILMQKCGAALVISLVPEKYRVFADNVLKNSPSFLDDVSLTVMSPIDFMLLSLEKDKQMKKEKKKKKNKNKIYQYQ